MKVIIQLDDNKPEQIEIRESRKEEFRLAVWKLLDNFFGIGLEVQSIYQCPSCKNIEIN